MHRAPTHKALVSSLSPHAAQRVICVQKYGTGSVDVACLDPTTRHETNYMMRETCQGFNDSSSLMSTDLASMSKAPSFLVHSPGRTREATAATSVKLRPACKTQKQPQKSRQKKEYSRVCKPHVLTEAWHNSWLWQIRALQKRRTRQKRRGRRQLPKLCWQRQRHCLE